MRSRTLSAVVLIFATLAACEADEQRARQPLLSSNPAVAPDQIDTWTTELLEERAEKDENFATSETSPMAGTQYLKSEPVELVYLTRDGKSFDLIYEESGDAVLSMTREDGVWRWQALAEDVACSRNDESVASDSAVDGPALFSIDDLRLSFYPSEERVTFIVFDHKREEMRTFEHLLYFDPDPAFALHAVLEAFAEPEPIVIPTTRGLEKTFYRYATIRFLIDGSEQSLTALKSALEGDGSQGLFIPFRDATTSVESYGAARYLEINDPEGTTFVLDFNRAFNPLCNYSPAYNCSLPPRENRLDVAIRAGELAYPH